MRPRRPAPRRRSRLRSEASSRPAPGGARVDGWPAPAPWVRAMLVYLHGFASGSGSFKARSTSRTGSPSTGLPLVVPDLDEGDFRATLPGQLLLLERPCGRGRPRPSLDRAARSRGALRLARAERPAGVPQRAAGREADLFWPVRGLGASRSLAAAGGVGARARGPARCGGAARRRSSAGWASVGPPSCLASTRGRGARRTSLDALFEASRALLGSGPRGGGRLARAAQLKQALPGRRRRPEL